MDYMKESLKMHELWRGKIEMVSRVPLATRTDLSLAYTPGVAQACLEIRDEPDRSFALTRRFNTVAVVTDGSAVLGLGDIGALAGMPVMEGKCVLFKEFGGVDAIPLCVSSKDVDEIVSAVSLFAGSFGGINLEDISAPRCFEIEKKLKEKLDIPVFHDDQHGTAIVVLAACLNALKVVDKSLSDCRIAVCGAGAAGTAIAKLMLSAGAGDVIMCDKAGIINREQHGGDVRFGEIARLTNRENRKGTLADAVKGADIFVGVSAPNILSQDMVRSMKADAIVMAMANPVPEIMPDAAKAAGARVVGTGRSDFPNQINNVLAFPGVFKGALAVRAREINEEMKVAAAHAIAGLAADGLSEEYILPDALDKRVAPAVAEAVALAAKKTGVNKI
ncbi:malic enzyme NAD binding domain protein [Subdoligranulum sp. CAG:314]|jgi:Malic enzyme|nr:malic enzyme NAD binding domain protein [Subdoligranulum sp. CAG:314]